MAENTILEVKNLSISFQSEEGLSQAVKNVSFTLRDNAILGIVGESGSGKSVTSLAIMGLITSPPGKIECGQILYQKDPGSWIDLNKLSQRSLRHYRGNHISMIFQEPMTSLNPVFTCGNQLSEAIMVHKKVNKRVAKQMAIDLFYEVLLPGPEDIYKSYPHQLSGGQKQRVMIAMAIACHPSILIADEPTTALDVTVQKRILELIRELQQKYGMSVIFISHDLGVISEIAEEVIVMKDGAIVESGSLNKVFNFPENPYTQGLLACRPLLSKNYKRLPTVQEFLEARDKNITKYFDKKYLHDDLEKDATKRKSGLTEKPLLKIRNLKTWFPGKRNFFGVPRMFVKAVDDVNFEVYPGETLGLVGESGCGKTTLGRSILRLIEPSGGSVFYRNEDFLNLGIPALRKKRKDLQIIFQDPYSSLNPRIPVGMAITEPMKVHGLHNSEKERKKTAINLLEKTGLNESYMYRYPHELSGGQRQRICIARALAVQPSFIVCDESVSALDVSVQAQILNLLNDLKREYNLTYVFISHDLSVVKFMSDRMMVMNQGKIIEYGDADTIYRHPESDYTKKLIEAIPGEQ